MLCKHSRSCTITRCRLLQGQPSPCFPVVVQSGTQSSCLTNERDLRALEGKGMDSKNAEGSSSLKKHNSSRDRNPFLCSSEQSQPSPSQADSVCVMKRVLSSPLCRTCRYEDLIIGMRDRKKVCTAVLEVNGLMRKAK